MSKNRSHGRIASVETMVRGGSLDADAAAGAASITVADAADFDEDGGWLAIGAILTGGEWDYTGAQLVEYVADDETGILTLSDPLAAAAEAGDPVHLWDPLYEEAVEYQEALVELDGDRDNPEEIVAEVAEGVGTLPEGDRGRPGESCTLKRISEDEWEVVAVGGRSKRSQRTRWEQDDFYVLTAADLTAGSATMPLSHRPNDEALTCVLAGVPQRPTEWSIDYDAQTLTIPLSGWEQLGMVLWVHYAYRKGIAGAAAAVLVPFEATGWRYKQVASGDATDYSGAAYDDSAWATGQAAFWNSGGSPGYVPPTTPHGSWDDYTQLWLRREFPACTGATISIQVEDNATIWVNGNLVVAQPEAGLAASNTNTSVDVPDGYLNAGAPNVLAIRCRDDSTSSTENLTFADFKVEGFAS